MTDIADRYRARAARLTEVVEGVPDDAWSNASPCEGWTARDVVRHLVETTAAVPTWAGLDPLASPDVDADPAAAWVATRDAMQSLLDDPERAGTTYEGMGGETTIGETVDRFIALDLVVHRWDLARASGQDDTIPADDLAAAQQIADGLGEMIRSEGVCGPAVEVAADASAQDRLLAHLGRTP